LGLSWVDLWSSWGRFWWSNLCFLGSMLSRSVCLPVFLSVSLSAINNSQTAHLLSLDSHPTHGHFERCLRLDAGTNFTPLVVLRSPLNKQNIFRFLFRVSLPNLSSELSSVFIVRIGLRIRSSGFVFRIYLPKYSSGFSLLDSSAVVDSPPFF
jgi:hypothetical protein